MSDKEIVDSGGRRERWEAPARTNRFLAVVDDPRIADFLKQWAASHGCSIFWGDAASDTELIAIGCFAIVADRKILSRRAWDAYVRFTKEVNDGEEIVLDGELMDCRDDTLCILLDDLDDWPLPRLPLVLRLHADAPEGVTFWLEQVLDAASRQAQAKEREMRNKYVPQEPETAAQGSS